jgi:hypothetical protein
VDVGAHLHQPCAGVRVVEFCFGGRTRDDAEGGDWKGDGDTWRGRATLPVPHFSHSSPCPRRAPCPSPPSSSFPLRASAFHAAAVGFFALAYSMRAARSSLRSPRLWSLLSSASLPFLLSVSLLLPGPQQIDPGVWCDVLTAGLAVDCGFFSFSHALLMEYASLLSGLPSSSPLFFFTCPRFIRDFAPLAQTLLSSFFPPPPVLFGPSDGATREKRVVGRHFAAAGRLVFSRFFA